jgi:dTDP-4-amino-4,6-dideoxygalactose transaminase
MQILQAPRASAILYNLLVNQRQANPWLLPANICPIVPLTFMKARVPFEFVDISPASLHMDLNEAEARIRQGDVGGLLYAHTYGDESTPDDFFALAKSLNPEFLIIDDRCLCIPKFETISQADLVLFSTGYAKIVELGSGGYAFLREGVKYGPVTLPFAPSSHAKLEAEYKAAIRERTRFHYHDSDWLLADFDLSPWDEYRREIEKKLDASLAHRKSLNEIYSSRLPKEIQLRGEYQTWRFNIRVQNQAEVIKAIFDEQLFASAHYASLAGIMSDGNAPVAEALGGEIINLFNDHYFTPRMAERVCEVIVKIAKW